MSGLAKLSLAAAAVLIPSGAAAMQPVNASGETTGASWQLQPAPQAEVVTAPEAAPAPEALPPAPMMAVEAAPPAPHHVAPPAMVHASPAAPVHAAAAQGTHSMHGGFHYQRVDRGWRMPHYWMGPRFRIANWGIYGFAPPPPGATWIRYYDDALLIDRYGVVREGRWDVEWDRYGERWERDHFGVPAYVGSGDYEPGAEDYAWVEGHPGPAPESWAHGYGHGGYGYGYGYGYAYGPVVVTETVTTTGPAYAHTGHKKHVKRHVKVEHHGADCDCTHAEPMAPPPPPPPPPKIYERG